MGLMIGTAMVLGSTAVQAAERLVPIETMPKPSLQLEARKPAAASLGPRTRERLTGLTLAGVSTEDLSALSFPSDANSLRERARILWGDLGLDGTGSDTTDVASTDVTGDTAFPTVSGMPEFSNGSAALALTRFTSLSGPVTTGAIESASEGDDAIYLEKGAATIDRLIESQVPGIARVEGGLILTRPMVIWPGASLQLGEEETLYLSREDGAYLISFGEMSVDGGTVTATTSRNARVPQFSPFVAVAGQGVFRANHGRFVGLGAASDQGAGQPDSMSGLSISAGLLYQPDQPSSILNSRFDDVHLVAISGVQDAIVSGNDFSGQYAGGLSVENSPRALISGNRMTAPGRYAAMHLRNLSNARVEKNTIASAKGKGVLVDGFSRSLTIDGNVVASAAGSGIELRDATCTDLSSNLVLASGGNGIELSRSGDIEARRNVSLFNGAAGISMSQQAVGSKLLVETNLVGRNRDGLRGAGLTDLTLKDNRLPNQMPRLLGGELGLKQTAWLTARKDNQPFNFSNGTQQAAATACEGI
ncbi:hypothetical protein AYJ57_24975 (plasmid) [Salipiger sp. CCB-MM3]|uniref:right-handed parallel beta-helix repeat-containing protein n=1 Tax=Salipiger sp. CCB-MM3 TaxID=1792508 RepID=UPI00080A993A|nr:right-handed parallel beta-helix repeat-containing protein [Salipiger sp. CCB-MM3]ANT63729.1 hypothetical protein AYJ57_24975 [Salipiger sp. CCB-MM3]